MRDPDIVNETSPRDIGFVEDEGIDRKQGPMSKDSAADVLILTDSARTLELAQDLKSIYRNIDIAQSVKGHLDNVPTINVNSECSRIIRGYNLVLSLHCKQLFPAALVTGVRCVNVHPGFNPFNRGWNPHVFSILNGLKAGVTIHEIDESVDHGPIIVQEEYVIKPWDTSGSAYNAILVIERELLLKYFPDIRARTYDVVRPAEEGTLNTKRDYENLREIDLDRRGTYRDFLNHLRALTHGEYRNAFFCDEDGGRVFVQLILELADNDKRVRAIVEDDPA